MRDLDNCEAGFGRDLFTTICCSHQHHSSNARFPTAAVFLILIKPGWSWQHLPSSAPFWEVWVSVSGPPTCAFLFPRYYGSCLLLHLLALWYLLLFGPFSNAYLMILYVVLLTYDFRLLPNQMGRTLEIMQSKSYSSAKHQTESGYMRSTIKTCLWQKQDQKPNSWFALMIPFSRITGEGFSSTFCGCTYKRGEVDFFLSHADSDSVKVVGTGAAWIQTFGDDSSPPNLLLA